MGKKYAVTIMERHYLGDSSFFFNASHTEIGEIDEDTEIFTDRNGNEYAPMLDPNTLESEISLAYANVCPLKDLTKSTGQATVRDAVAEFDYLCKQVVYLVGLQEDGEVYCISLNLENMKKTAEAAMKGQNGGSGEPTDEELEEDEEDVDALQELVEQVVVGNFSLKELKDIVSQLKENHDKIEQAIDSIEMQIEASEKGESAIKLPSDDPEKRDDAEEAMSEEEAEAFIEKWKKENSTARKRKIDINDLYQKVIKTLIAQDEPARRVIAELARKEMDERKKKQGILITGATGVGKTELMRLIAKHLDKPFIKVDSTQITIPGYVGKDIEEVLWDLYVKCGKDIDKTQSAIIFFDEIDKKGSDKKSDVSGQGVLNVLLPFVEGATYDACPDMKTQKVKVPIDTSNMTVIFGGAFSDVYKNLRINNDIGFGGVVSSKPRYRKATTQDFVDRGMMTDEFMGRVTVVKLNDLDVEDIKRIMLESDESAMKIQKEIFEQLGVKLTFTDEFTNKVAQRSYDKKSGARGINSIIDDSTWKAFDDVHCHPGEYEEVIIDDKTVDNPEAYQLVKKRGNQS